MELTIKDFNYQDSEKKVSKIIKEHYPSVSLKFDGTKKELRVIGMKKEKVQTVYNMLLVINRFDLK
jgi:uncharacterized protein YajQ (UPF0234 family)